MAASMTRRSPLVLNMKLYKSSSRRAENAARRILKREKACPHRDLSNDEKAVKIFHQHRDPMTTPQSVNIHS